FPSFVNDDKLGGIEFDVAESKHDRTRKLEEVCGQFSAVASIRSPIPNCTGTMESHIEPAGKASFLSPMSRPIFLAFALLCCNALADSPAVISELEKIQNESATKTASIGFCM